MMKQIFYFQGNKKITYTLKTGVRAKLLRLEINPRGELVAICPRFMGRKEAEEFIIAKKRWIFSRLRALKKYKYLSIQGKNKRHYLIYREQAFNFVKNKIDYFNDFYSFSFNQIKVKNQQSRWGSCSAKKNLNFNYKLLFLPDNLASYIIIHELCHLQELNHSPSFWSLVAKSAPDYQQLRQELRRYRF